MKNPINSILLWVFLLPAAIYKQLGVDLPQLRAILTSKLIADDRRVSGFQRMRRRQEETENNSATLMTMLISLLMGLLLLFMFILTDDLTRMSFYFGSLSFFLAMFLITDFSDILIDPKDNYIILPKPVSSITFVVSRLLHILIHLAKILLPLSLPGLIAVGVSRGISGGIGFIFCIVFLALLTFAIVNAAYLLIIRVFSPGKLNSIIASVQIAFSVILYATWQLLPRFLDQNNIANMVLSPSGWLWLIPVYWFAKAWIFIHAFSIKGDEWLGFLMSVGIPLASLWLMVRYLAPSFFRKITLIQEGVEIKKEKSTGSLTPEIPSSRGLGSTLSRIWSRPGLERASFVFLWTLTGRTRDFKMKVYPSIGYMIVILVIFGFRSWNQLLSARDSLMYTENSRIVFLVLSVVYISSFIFMGAILQLPYTEKFNAAWVYYIAPLRQPGEIIRGAIKVLLTKFFLTVVLLVFIMGIWLFGFSILPNLIFGFSNVLLMCTLFAWLAMERLPFSIAVKNQARGEITSRNLIMLVMLGFFGIPHYFLFYHPLILCSMAVLTFTAALVILHYTKNISWKYIKDA